MARRAAFPSRRTMYRLTAASVVLLAALPVLAQAPRITPKGDPSVRNDTIYRLAVDPAAHPEESYVVLLDDGVVRYEADGRGSRTYRMVVQILKEEAVDNFNEHRFSYLPNRQKLTVNWIRVVRPDGSVVSDKPAVTQDADVPASMGDPVYTERRVKRATLAGVAVGTIVDYSVTTEITKPVLDGDWLESWSVHMGVPVLRSRYVLDVPASVQPRIREENLDFKRAEQVVGGRRVLTWARKDVPKLEGEPFAADSNGVHMRLLVSAPTEWKRVAAFYGGLAKDRYVLTPELEKKVASLVAAARTRDDTIRAVHRWVAQDIRYVSVSLGMGGYQPRVPAEVFSTGFGDCKDKATIFVAALRRLGIGAHPVLLSASGGVERAHPSISQFDHAIAAVEKPGGGYVFTDLTSELNPYGSLPYPEQGEFGLVVHPDGRAEEITFPKDPVDSNVTRTRITGTLSPEGTFSGTYVESGFGASAISLRDAFSVPLDSARRVNGTRALAQNLFEGAKGDTLIVFDGKDFSAAPSITLRLSGGRAATPSGDMLILKLPHRSMASFSALAEQLEQRPKRRYPIEAENVTGATVADNQIELTLPTGWRARLPKSIDAPSPFGHYTVKYEQAGDKLRVTRRFSGARGVLPPERVGDLIAWFRQVGADNQDFIVLERAPTAGVGSGTRTP